MLKTLTDSKRTSDSFVRWIASTSYTGKSESIPNYESVIARQLSSGPHLGQEIKSSILEEANQSMNLMLDRFDRPSVDELYYRFTMAQGALIHVEVDPELCYRLGFTSYQFLGKALSPEIVPSENLAHKKHMYDRAWAGETVDYIGAGLNGTAYTARMSPVYDESDRIIFVDVVCRLLESLHIDDDVLEEVGELEPRTLSRGSVTVWP